MIRGLLILGFLFSLVLFFPNSANADVKSDVLRLRLGMSKEAAHKILQKIGKLEKNESKQQEVWALSDNQQFSYIIIAFNKEYTEVRFITAKARENGKRVRYDEVLDIKKARQAGSQANLNYIQDVPARGKKAAYKIVARGTDPIFLTYFSIERIYQ
jgi:anaerobic ribonucleoside-triphosphate reductase